MALAFDAPNGPAERIVLPPLAALARLLGKERTIERYLSLDSHPSAQVAIGRLPDQVMRRTTP